MKIFDVEHLLTGKKVVYCSSECQTADWKSHKIQCGKNSRAIYVDSLGC